MKKSLRKTAGALLNSIFRHMPYSPYKVRRKINRYVMNKRVDGYFIRLFYVFLCYKYARKYQIEIGVNSKVGSPLNLPHPRNIIIGEYATVGDGCTIFNNVVIGTKGGDEQYPTIGNNVTIYAGAKIFGNITIGDNCVIGANSVVFDSFPDNSIIAGIPAKVVNKR